MYLLMQWLVTSLTIMMIPYLVSGVHVNGFGAAVAAAAVLGILNVLVKPILFVLTLPITVFTLGIFYFVLNAILFKWVGALVSGFGVDSFGSAFLASLIVSFVSWLFSISVKKQNGQSRRVVVVRSSDSGRVRDLN